VGVTSGAGAWMQRIVRGLTGSREPGAAEALQRTGDGRSAAPRKGSRTAVMGRGFRLLVAALENDPNGARQRQLAATFSHVQDARVARLDEPVDLAAWGAEQQVRSILVGRARRLLREHRGQILVFGEVLKDGASLRLYFCPQFGSLDDDAAPFELQHASTPARLAEKLRSAVVEDLDALRWLLVETRCDAGAMRDASLLLHQAEAMAEARVLVDSPYVNAELARTRMELHCFLHQSGVAGRLETAIEVGRGALPDLRPSPYEFARTAIVLAKCLHLHAAASRSTSPAIEGEEICRWALDVLASRTPIFDFAPFELRGRSKARFYELMHELAQQGEGHRYEDELRELAVQFSALQAVELGDAAAIRDTMSKIARDHPRPGYQHVFTAFEARAAVALVEQRGVEDLRAEVAQAARGMSPWASGFLERVVVHRTALCGEDPAIVADDDGVVARCWQLTQDYRSYLHGLLQVIDEWRPGRRFAVSARGRLGLSPHA
jgi:hypothetical protein